MEKNMLLVTSWLNPKLILWFLKSRPHFSLISQTYLILKANRYIALSFSGCLWFTPFLGENMFIWFCYCDTLKVWYYKLGFGAKKTMKIKVSVNMQDAFLVVTELFSPQSRYLYKSWKSPSVFWKMTIFQTSFLYPLLILWQGLYFLDVPCSLPFCVYCYSFTINSLSTSKWANCKVWGSIQPGLK